MYKIKQIPEDFIVTEIADHSPLEAGNYSLYVMKKVNYTTQRAVQQIAISLHMNPKLISYAGLKDKRAVTFQYITIKKKKASLMLKDISLEFLGYLNDPVYIGNLDGNRFEITVRNITKKPKPIDRMPNYYGVQRFSSSNAERGKAIVRKRFDEACRLIRANDNDYRSAIEEHLQKQANDYVGALKVIPFRILRLYLHAYQSLLWNNTLRMVKKKTDVKIPLIGFSTEIGDDEVGKQIKNLMEEEGITFSDFIIRQLPHLSIEGEDRPAFVELKDLVIGELEDDELNTGMKKCLVRFTLPKGSYATVAIDELFS